MQRADRGRMEINRRMWDESVGLHTGSPSYDVPRFKKGWIPILPLEIREVGPVRGQTLLHLQCHFGMDTLSWARRGARVTGVDFSPAAVAAARQLAAEVGLDARFVRSNVYTAAQRLHDTFDVVYTGKGALCWLPDLTRWAKTVARFLKPGGRLFFLEDHPLSEAYQRGRDADRLVLTNPYFRHQPIRDESPGTYAAPEAKLRNALSFSWIHPVSEVLNALIDAGLRIERMIEYPYTYWHKFPFLRQGRDGFWHLREEDGEIPLMYSLRARRPLSAR
ncbi:MAG: methyltransferase [Thermoplasmata archaeon]